MKKLFSALLVLSACLIVAQAAYAGEYSGLQTGLDYNASGSTAATVNCTVGATAGATPGRRVVVFGIYGGTDKDAAALTIGKGDTTGATSNYTVVDWQPIATTTNRQFEQENEGKPVFIGDLNYSYQFLLDSTAKNSLRIVWEAQ